MSTPTNKYQLGQEVWFTSRGPGRLCLPIVRPTYVVGVFPEPRYAVRSVYGLKAFTEDPSRSSVNCLEEFLYGSRIEAVAHVVECLPTLIEIATENVESLLRLSSRGMLEEAEIDEWEEYLEGLQGLLKRYQAELDFFS